MKYHGQKVQYTFIMEKSPILKHNYHLERLKNMIFQIEIKENLFIT